MVKRKVKRYTSKPIKLNPDIWVRQGDIKTVRKHKLKEQFGKCAVTGIKLYVGALDHSHENGKCRGVLCQDVNMLEGRFLKLFKKSKIEEKYQISFSDFLINLGNYLKIDNTHEKYHYLYMTDFRKVIRRLGKDKLINLLYEDFNIVMSDSASLDEIVHTYMQLWVLGLNSKEELAVKNRRQTYIKYLKQMEESNEADSNK
jgi:hypothetical protein